MARSSEDPTKKPGEHEPYVSFDEESTVSIKPAFADDDPTEPVHIDEGAVDDSASSPDGTMLPASSIVLQRVMSEVERLRGLAGSRGARLTEEIITALRLGVAIPGPTRLNPDQAIAATSSLLALADDQYEHAARLLSRAGLDESGVPIPRADRDGERALILRALAERRGKLETGVLSSFIRRLGIPVASDRNLQEIAAFAEEIRGQGRR